MREIIQTKGKLQRGLLRRGVNVQVGVHVEVETTSIQGLEFWSPRDGQIEGLGGEKAFPLK